MNPTKLLCTLLAAGLAVAAIAQEEPVTGTPQSDDPTAVVPAEPPPPPSEPGIHHQHLDRLAGDWDLTIRLWTSLEGEPVTAAGTAEARWILGGRFLWTVYRAELLGEPFEAWMVEGYDNQALEYVATWRDTQGTYTLIYRGACQPTEPPPEGAAPAAPGGEVPPGFEGAYRRMSSQVTDPVSAQVFNVFNEILTEEDGSAYLLRSFLELPEREPFQNLEISARRKAGDS